MDLRPIRFAFSVCTSSLLFALMPVALMPGSASGQESAPEIRRGFTGKQLFGHQWKPIDSEPQDFAVPFTRGSVGKPQRVTNPVFARNPTVVKRKGANGDGLGPLFNASSCAQCHEGGGSSGVDRNVTLITVDPRSTAISDTKQGGVDLLHVFPGLIGQQGALIFNTVVHDHSTRPGFSEIRGQLADYVPGGIEDHWFDPEKRNSSAIAQQPVIAGRYGTVDFYLSQRNAPALFGVGTIESISDFRIQKLADRQFAKSDGKISGRFVGKFGQRGQVSSLATFVSQACAGELGLNMGTFAVKWSDIEVPSQESVRRPTRSSAPAALPIATQPGDPADFDYANFGLDMTATELTKLTNFVGSIPRPIEEPQLDHTLRQVLKGERVFNSIGCSACHVPDLHPVSGMFSDLLLHDMGPALQSPFPAPLGDTQTTSVFRVPTFRVRGPFVSSPQQYYGSVGSRSQLPAPHPLAKPSNPTFPRGETPESETLTWDALQREWKTPPLWGVADTGPYLHDGRATTIEEAILWHGGEAQSSCDAYIDSMRIDKDLVLAFLSSLRAPTELYAQIE